MKENFYQQIKNLLFQQNLIFEKKLLFFSDPPNCLSPTQTIPANIGRSVTLFCEVDSSLSNVTFFWYSRNIHKTEAKIENKGLKSKLIIYPKNEEDFGQYSCWARNLAGNQLDPCFYNIYG